MLTPLMTLFVVVVIFLFIKIFFARKTKAIVSPSVCFISFSDNEYVEELNFDKEKLTPLFKTSIDSFKVLPRCDVLFLYCRLDAEGRIEGLSKTLQHVAQETNCVVMIVASENSTESYLASDTKFFQGKINLIMTLGRNGENFTRFFIELFQLMKLGVPMPSAWVKIAPQVNSDKYTNNPELIFVCGAGKVIFA